MGKRKRCETASPRDERRKAKWKRSDERAKREKSDSEEIERASGRERGRGRGREREGGREQQS